MIIEIKFETKDPQLNRLYRTMQMCWDADNRGSIGTARRHAFTAKSMASGMAYESQNEVYFGRESDRLFWSTNILGQATEYLAVTAGHGD